MGVLKHFEKRQKTYPQNVKGKFRRLKNILNFVFLSIYLFFPFLRWDRGIAAPDQGILIDLPNSRLYFFAIEIWPEEIYYLAGVLILAAVALFFVTSLFGRIWCGYACFQTVWTDIFIKIERLFQGDRNQRIQLDRKKFSFQNIWRKTATHLTWILIGLITGFCFTLYFNDSFESIKQLLHFNLSETTIGWSIGIAAATYIMAGFAREQVCNYMCPYARFQSAMFDSKTLIITYDEKRGEPRGKFKQGDSWENRGDCIECKQCVVVCPANIDIRDGLQMECIACGLCIDACDNVMEKIGKPKGLIRYDTEENLKNNDSAKNTKFKFLRPRTFYYAAILLIVGVMILFNLIFRPVLNLQIVPDRNPIFVMLSSGDIRNGYTIKISNKTHENKSYSLKIEGIKDLESKVQDVEGMELNNLPVAAESVASFKIFVISKTENLDLNSGRNEISFIATDNGTKELTISKTIFISK